MASSSYDINQTVYREFILFDKTTADQFLTMARTVLVSCRKKSSNLDKFLSIFTTSQAKGMSRFISWIDRLMIETNEIEFLSSLQRLIKEVEDNFVQHRCSGSDSENNLIESLNTVIVYLKSIINPYEAILESGFPFSSMTELFFSEKKNQLNSALNCIHQIRSFNTIRRELNYEDISEGIIDQEVVRDQGVIIKYRISYRHHGELISCYISDEVYTRLKLFKKDNLVICVALEAFRCGLDQIACLSVAHHIKFISQSLLTYINHIAPNQRVNNLETDEKNVIGDMFFNYFFTTLDESYLEIHFPSSSDELRRLYYDVFSYTDMHRDGFQRSQRDILPSLPDKEERYLPCYNDTDVFLDHLNTHVKFNGLKGCHVVLATNKVTGHIHCFHVHPGHLTSGSDYFFSKRSGAYVPYTLTPKNPHDIVIITTTHSENTHLIEQKIREKTHVHSLSWLHVHTGATTANIYYDAIDDSAIVSINSFDGLEREKVIQCIEHVRLSPRQKNASSYLEPILVRSLFSGKNYYGERKPKEIVCEKIGENLYLADRLIQDGAGGVIVSPGSIKSQFFIDVNGQAQATKQDEYSLSIAETATLVMKKQMTLSLDDVSVARPTASF
jgi:hypothetical protein